MGIECVWITEDVLRRELKRISGHKIFGFLIEQRFQSHDWKEYARRFLIERLA